MTRISDECLVGWRGWAVKEIDGTEFLITARGTNNFVWLPGNKAIAECAKNNPVPCSKSCAGYGHGCGFYAAKSRTAIPFYPSTTMLIVGRVSMWGRVKEHVFGYRAQFAYPLELRACRTTIPYRRRKGLLERLSTTYGLDW